MQMKRLGTILSAAFVLLSFVGCDDGPVLGTVEGDLTVDGKPVGKVTLTFTPTTPGGSVSYGRTDSKGHYKLMFTDTKSGAMLGTHNVTLEQTRISKSELAEMKAEGQDVPDEFVPLPKSAMKEGLTAEVKKGRNTINFDLSSKK